MKETPVVKEIQIALSHGDVRLFRNNRGTAWRGTVITLPNGDLLIKNPVIVHFGLADGSGDLVGLASKIITPSMLGQRIAQFASIEVKTIGGRTAAKRRESQQTWIDLVRGFGGIAGIARSVEEARRILLP